MIFRQLFDPESSTYTYLIGDPKAGEAALVDPVREQIPRDLGLVSELGLRLVLVLDTHVHADHVTASGRVRELTGARTVVGVGAAPCADVLRVGGVKVRVLGTPGHTDESVSYLVGDRVLTGDALLVRGCGRTDFQNGDPGALYDSITRVLFALPDGTRVFPAHDYRGMTESSIGEEKRYNARVAGRSREEFVALMRALNLPAPKKMQEAVPANQACGLPEGPSASPEPSSPAGFAVQSAGRA